MPLHREWKETRPRPSPSSEVLRGQERPWVASFMQLGSSRRIVISIKNLRSIGFPALRSLCVVVVWLSPNSQLVPQTDAFDQEQTKSHNISIENCGKSMQGDPSPLPCIIPDLNQTLRNELFHVRHEFANIDPEELEGLRHLPHPLPDFPGAPGLVFSTSIPGTLTGNAIIHTAMPKSSCRNIR